MTDLDGKFSIEVTGKDEIEISYIGYKTQTIEVGDLGVLNVKMEGNNEVLDEVVVVGAGTQKKVSITGAITATEGIQLKAPTSSLTSSLAGKLAGVISTNSSGEPGSTSAFYIQQNQWSCHTTKRIDATDIERRSRTRLTTAVRRNDTSQFTIQ